MNEVIPDEVWPVTGMVGSTRGLDGRRDGEAPGRRTPAPRRSPARTKSQMAPAMNWRIMMSQGIRAISPDQMMSSRNMMAPIVGEIADRSHLMSVFLIRA